jgi:hypothetical protein
MKLNKYIHKRLMEVAASIETCWAETPAVAVTEENIDDWIADWYNDTFINTRDDKKPRGPPMWLCGPRWYDRRKRMIKEAEKLKAAEERSYEKDE